MFEETLYYPSEGEQATNTLVIGGLLSVLVLPLLFVLGFLVLVLERTANESKDVPEFDDWEDLAVKGAAGLAITAAFYAVPVLLFAAFGDVGIVTGSSEASLAGLGVVELGSLLLALALTFVYPAALTNYAATGEIGAAFAFGDIADVITAENYLDAWLVGFVLFFGGLALLAVLSIVSFVGTIVALFLNFYIQVAAYRAFGVAFERSTSVRASTTTDTAAA